VKPALIVIFGASGDLAYRKLLPAFYALCAEGHMPEKYAIVGVARSEYTDEEFRDHVKDGVKEYSRHGESVDRAWDNFAPCVYYHTLPAYDAVEGYEALKQRIKSINDDHQLEGNMLFYLSTPPSLYGTIPEFLGEVGLARGSGWRRIIVEKPFGSDLESAHRLNDQLHAIFDENAIYRIDHYLGKETVQNLMVFRFANALFEPIWNRQYIDHVQISTLETVDVGSRAGYYDQSGILRDMFQNHMMQLLTLTAMEAPVAFEAGPLRDEKVKVLRALDMIEPHEVDVRTVRAQYQGYLDAEGVAEGSETPTFAAIQLGISNWRWHGVPFYLRSGKALNKKLTEIVVQFRGTPLQYFKQNGGAMPTPNQLGICIQPDEGFHLRISSKQPGAGFTTVPTDLTFHFDDQFGESALPEAYERLLLDAIQGDPSLFARSDEIEWSWRMVDKIIEGWSSDAAPAMATYEKGTWGPAEADELLSKSGRSWQYGCIHEE
jgi:glucose-6-phosphate 1-dehydrogenase